MNFEDQYQPVLMAIESIIMGYYKEHDALVDHNVDKVLEHLVRVYTAQIKGRTEPKSRLKGMEEDLIGGVQLVCEFYLGNVDLEDSDEDVEGAENDSEDATTDADDDDESEEIEMPNLTTQEIIDCLKRLRSSIKLWGGTYGRRGYLGYISNFFA